MTRLLVTASAPCRIDMGGTLDVPAFYMMLGAHRPMTVNMALALRTRVRVQAHEKGRIQIRATGFETLDVPAGAGGYNHPLGLMLAIVNAFDLSGLDIGIDSASPPRAGLGGSSVAAVALTGALMALKDTNIIKKPSFPDEVAYIAGQIESAVVARPCGIQDQLAAAFGGTHGWEWKLRSDRIQNYERTPLLEAGTLENLEKHLLVAYVGKPHVSIAVNQQWVTQFMGGRFGETWIRIIALTRYFSQALQSGDYRQAGALMNAEVELRCKMTPEVLDPTARQLVSLARKHDCGARFCGAGAGGCVWALGESGAVGDLKNSWQALFDQEKKHPGKLLPSRLDARGLWVETFPAATV